MFVFCVRFLPRRKAVKGKRGCRFGCFHIELIKDAEGKQKTICKKGWPRVQKACFSRLQYETEDLARQEEFKNDLSWHHTTASATLQNVVSLDPQHRLILPLAS